MDKAKTPHSLICDYLSLLGVPYTRDYAVGQFENMPFKTMFGFLKLLQTYGIRSEAYMLSDKSEITALTPPFIAMTRGGQVIVTEVGPSYVGYLSQGVAERARTGDFIKGWDGSVFISYPGADSCEPDYRLHARLAFFGKAKKWVLSVCFMFLLVFLFAAGGLYHYVSAYFIVAVDLAGLYFTYLLVQKSMHIRNAAADRVCGVLQAGGCDDILDMKASKFFGLFGWSEVGFSYFSVSLLVLLMLPDMLPWLALANVCCLPFTVWSIWYQRFRAHRWCTLCVCVQASLWALFFAYLSGGWLRMAWPLSIQFFALGAAYVGVMLGLNAVMPLMERRN